MTSLIHLFQTVGLLASAFLIAVLFVLSGMAIRRHREKKARIRRLRFAAHSDRRHSNLD